MAQPLLALKWVQGLSHSWMSSVGRVSGSAALRMSSWGYWRILVGRTKTIASDQRGGACLRTRRVLTISDTIVLLTRGDAAEVLPVHGLICKELVSESLRMGIPLRGATSHGEFSASEGTILVGPAVDEAASWHEALDWIGVVMTPSAEYKCEPSAPWCQYAKAPVKGLGSRTLWCVDWGEKWADDTEIRKLFSEVGPMDTAIAVKYMNTLDFLRDRISNRPQPAQPVVLQIKAHGKRSRTGESHRGSRHAIFQ